MDGRVTPPKLACEQALRVALVEGREKEGELANTSLEFEYWHQKSRYERLIGRDNCFSMFVCIRARFRFSLIGGNLTAQSTESHRRIVGGIQIPEKRRCCKLSFIFPPRRQSAPESLLDNQRMREYCWVNFVLILTCHS